MRWTPTNALMIASVSSPDASPEKEIPAMETAPRRVIDRLQTGLSDRATAARPWKGKNQRNGPRRPLEGHRGRPFRRVEYGLPTTGGGRATGPGWLGRASRGRNGTGLGTW